MKALFAGIFRSLRGFNYRVWIAGAFVSNVGTWVQRTAQDWLVLTQLTDHDASAVGLVMAMFRPVRIFFDPLIAALFPIPKVALMPLFLLAFGFGDADGDHLRGVIPFVDRGGDVEAFVALQPDQPAAERGREHLGDLGLADAGLAFQKQRPAHPQRQIRHRRQRPLGEIAARGQQLEHRIDGIG